MEDHASMMEKELADLSRKKTEIDQQHEKAAETNKIRALLDQEKSDFDFKKSQLKIAEDTLASEQRIWEKVQKLSAKDFLDMQKEVEDLKRESARSRQMYEEKDW